MILSKKIILLLIILLFNLNCFATDDFAHTLDLAKLSSCKDIAEEIQKTPRLTKVAHPEYSLGEGCPIGRGGSPQSKLKALSVGPFPWRFEVTNGYREGFVYYALLGYANELSGDIPFAYRCYQNSLACIDKDKSFNYPLPRVEIYLGIGRTCLASGRYMDAKDWLDNAFLEAGDDLQLQAAIDRALIQRANEIGDYPEVIFLFQHLEQLESEKVRKCEGNSPFSKGGKGALNSPPVLGGVPEGRGGLTKPEIANYGQILFYSRKDREGFSKLLTGISKLGIDNNLGVKDPLVDKFLNNIMRADDDEVKWFYNLLGCAIVDARAKAGDEEYLAFLCNARTLFCKVYDFLDSEDDLKKVKERIDEVRRQIAAGGSIFKNENKYSVSGNRYPVKKKKISKSSNRKIDKSGNMEKTPGIILEDLLMFADWKLKNKDYKTARTNYFLAYQMATGIFANLEYDGTTFANAANMGSIFCDLHIGPHSKPKTSMFELDESIRSAELTLQLYRKASNDLQRNKYDVKMAIKSLPQAHPILADYYSKKVHLYLCSNECNAEKANKCYQKYFQRTTDMRAAYNCSISAYGEWCETCVIAGKMELAFKITVMGLSYISNPDARDNFGYPLELFSWASNEDLERFNQIFKASKIYGMLANIGISWSEAADWYKLYGKKEETIRKYMVQGKYHEALELLDSKHKQSGHYFKIAHIYANLGETNKSFEAMLTAWRKRGRLGSQARYPTFEAKFLNSFIDNVETNILDDYYQWLTQIEKQCMSRGRTGDTTRIQQTLMDIKTAEQENKNFNKDF